jgi:hypothetical protein
MLICHAYKVGIYGICNGEMSEILNQGNKTMSELRVCDYVYVLFSWILSLERFV